MAGGLTLAVSLWSAEDLSLVGREGSANAHAHAHMHTCTCTHMHMHMHMQMHMHMHMHMHMQMQMHMHIFLQRAVAHICACPHTFVNALGHEAQHDFCWHTPGISVCTALGCSRAS